MGDSPSFYGGGFARHAWARVASKGGWSSEGFLCQRRALSSWVVSHLPRILRAAPYNWFSSKNLRSIPEIFDSSRRTLLPH